MTDKSPTTERSFTVWAPTDLIAQIDNHLRDLSARHAPGRFSRQGWVLELVRRELAAAQPAGVR